MFSDLGSRSAPDLAAQVEAQKESFVPRKSTRHGAYRLTASVSKDTYCLLSKQLVSCSLSSIIYVACPLLTITDMRSQENGPDEREPLLQQGHVDAGEGGDSREVISFEEDDDSDPRQWPRRRKMTNVGIIALMSGEYRFDIYVSVCIAD